jgi:sulfur relay protein TusB/DsrH
MAVLIEVFRNDFAGKGCLTLTKNVLDYVCDKQGDFDVRLLSVSSDVAKERGITRAPSIMINRKVTALGVSSIEEIERLIEQAKSKNMGILLSKSPFESEDAHLAFRLAIEALDLGDSVDVFLLGDGVWMAKTELTGEIKDMLNIFIEKEGKMIVSSPHLKAAGIGQDRIEKTAKILDKPYDVLVDLIMTEWDKVVTF